MARNTKRDVERTRAHIELGAAKLRAGGDPQIADTLEALLQPYGYRLLVVDRAPARDGQNDMNLAISVAEPLRAAILAEADRTESNLSAVLTDGLQRALDGKWTPPPASRARRNSGIVKVNLNVPVDADTLKSLRAKLPEMTGRLGYKVTPPQIALSWLVQEFGLEEQLND
ncbi:hypothetical protein ACFW9D_05710 [Streptomyces sp. NPDC059524]|uniref:hypothetical protein n=1 Tax=Streptomyces sp. NPDC059524 TaxID=3346856 RepID=UPI0036926878